MINLNTPWQKSKIVQILHKLLGLSGRSLWGQSDLKINPFALWTAKKYFKLLFFRTGLWVNLEEYCRFFISNKTIRKKYPLYKNSTFTGFKISLYSNCSTFAINNYCFNLWDMVIILFKTIFCKQLWYNQIICFMVLVEKYIFAMKQGENYLFLIRKSGGTVA